MAKKQPKEIVYNTNVLDVVLEDVLHNSMMPYSESVILDRAIPRVEDGLKPVQRRVLYSMHEMSLTPDKPHKKCARIVGDCLGKYHPHGDSSVYGALVRLAQPFAMRMPLVDGHGNFGSVDGDSAAAMRYTEARMSALALELLRDLDKDTVQWTANFDDSLEEPTTLPGRFPNLLVNGASGIAVGLATDIPTHNMGECIDAVIAYIDNPRITTKELLKVFHGPDFPTGGLLIVTDSLENVYETGLGKCKVRARLHIENDDNGKKNIVITEIPYGVSKSALLAKIGEMKTSNSDALLANVYDIVDESDKAGMRAVIKCKRDADVNRIVEMLYKKTNLERTVPINMMAIANGKPEQLSLRAYLGYYSEYQRQIIYKRAVYDLKAAKARAEIVEGLLIAIRNIDEVIKIIKESESTQKAKETLRSRFDLSDAQAQAILDMRLKNLARLEVGKLEEELAELKKRIADLESIIASKSKQFSIVKRELLEVKKSQNSPRMTVIVDGDVQMNYSAPTEAEAVQYRDGILTVNNDGLMRFMSQKTFVTAQKDVESMTVDTLPLQYVSVNNKGTLYVVTDMGNLAKLDVTDLPEKRFKEKPFKLLSVNQDAGTNEKVVKVLFFDGAPAGELLLFTSGGIVKRVDLSEFNSASKAYFKAINLADGDSVISAEIVEEENTVMEITALGQVLRYNLDEVPTQGRAASGVKGVKLNDGDKVVYAGQNDDEGEVIVVTDSGYAKRVILATVDITSRYNKGVKIVELDKSQVKFAGLVKMPYNVAISEGGRTHLINTEDIRIDGRTTKGKQMYKNTKIDVVATFDDGNN
ncbi:MAG: DNA topoisomerase 4 subunit A [Bacteroides sp.]|nr:DNA topoisomerase 4 subunit A [Bacillota bacterium]MCM1394418.1 DNA topoisomerase 4 subunit A [[Eubacterium] siraeum]MCM1455315.1 DNA topoisomerase 4 subunit A [Bacteroides sp.]